ncbi:hypothetical protein ACFOYW_00560 [Gryllotalpicola reticulitermitis]|uniref:Uncharacterized protein n=1 Tax=Gryllotalpicola reticulitermitis TaxID=1184153 RepID=A0ABV8Q1K8_9MICO
MSMKLDIDESQRTNKRAPRTWRAPVARRSSLVAAAVWAVASAILTCYWIRTPGVIWGPVAAISAAAITLPAGVVAAITTSLLARYPTQPMRLMIMAAGLVTAVAACFAAYIGLFAVAALVG